MPNTENGISKLIRNDFEERKCHCECVALRGDSQNQSESHRLRERTLWFCVHSWNHRTTKKGKTQWFLWKFGTSVSVHRRRENHKSRFGRKENHSLGTNKTQKRITFINVWAHKIGKNNRRKIWKTTFVVFIDFIRFAVNFESMFGKKWNSKRLNQKVLWNHCKWTYYTQKIKSEQKWTKWNEKWTFDSKIINIDNSVTK